MAFDLIQISDLRNLADCEIFPSKGINLVQGANGSGKSSLLEAIYILGRGRSFRDNQTNNVVQRGKSSFTVFGKKQQHSNQIAIGVNYSSKGSIVKINGERVSKLSSLVKETPIHIITPRSHEIIDKGSSTRRRFLEWGVFHVEPKYQYYWNRYQRALSQRNSALKENSKTVTLWNKELAESGTRLHEYRSIYFEHLKAEFDIQLAKLKLDFGLEISMYQGWTIEKSLDQALEDGLSADVKRRFTRIGPHRADVIFTIDKRPFSKWGSRGQFKMAIFALFLAQASVIRILTLKNPILLVDDLTAELDKENADRVIEHLFCQSSQIFITTTDKSFFVSEKEGKMFHVEHGVVGEQRV